MLKRRQNDCQLQRSRTLNSPNRGDYTIPSIDHGVKIRPDQVKSSSLAKLAKLSRVESNVSEEE